VAHGSWRSAPTCPGGLAAAHERDLSTGYQPIPSCGRRETLSCSGSGARGGVQDPTPSSAAAPGPSSPIAELARHVMGRASPHPTQMRTRPVTPLLHFARTGLEHTSGPARTFTLDGANALHLLAARAPPLPTLPITAENCPGRLSLQTATRPALFAADHHDSVKRGGRHVSTKALAKRPAERYGDAAEMRRHRALAPRDRRGIQVTTTPRLRPQELVPFDFPMGA